MKLSKGQILELEITSLAYGGMGISHYDDIIIFVKGAIPGEKVKAKIYKKKKNYLEAYTIENIEASKHSTDSICEHFGICGGCSFQNLNYNEQLNQKNMQVRDLFTRIGGITSPNVHKIIGCKEHYNYRNKMEFSYSSNKWIIDLESQDTNSNENAFGLHVKGRFDKIVDINDCHITGNLSNNIFKSIKSELRIKKIEPFNIKTRSGYLRNIIIREGHQTNEVSINFIITNSETKQLLPIIDKIVKDYKEIKSIKSSTVKPNSGSSFSDQEKVLFGDDHISEKIDNYLFKISSNSFFQTNSKQSRVLYDLIVKIADFKGNEIVYDLYCGTGSIGIYIAKYVKMVYGIEIVMSAVIDAIENAKNNKTKNIQFFHGDLVNTFQDNPELKLIKSPDVIILDPPRPGIHLNTLTEIVKFNPKKIIYVSCNPSTQARDVNILMQNGYQLISMQPVDMFPHTPHIENIVLLTKDE